MSDTTLPPSSPTPLTPLARLLDGRRISGADGSTALVEFEVTDDWAQGRTAFGGLTSAFGLQAMREVLPREAAAGFALRALQTSFVGPVSVGTVMVEAVLLRQGRNVCQVQATLREQGQVAAVMLGVFAKDRESSMRTHSLRRPDPSHSPDRLPASRPVAGQPQFLRHFDLRWDDGPRPGTGDPGLTTRIHMRMVDADGLDDEMLTVLFADVSPTPATGQFNQRPAASSVSWALEARRLSDAAPRSGWWRADNESLVVDAGYVNHAARLWAPSGELAALAYQVVAIFG